MSLPIKILISSVHGASGPLRSASSASEKPLDRIEIREVGRHNSDLARPRSMRMEKAVDLVGEQVP